MGLKNKKIAIVTLYDEFNIGNKLQNYALQEILKKYADSVTTLTYSEAREIYPLMGWKGKLVALLGYPKETAREKRAIIRRFRRFAEFSKKYIVTEKPCKFIEHDEETNKKYDYFVTGSDQVWRNFSGKDEEIDYFMLRFADESKRVCYAPSIGRNEIPAEFRERFVEGINGFKYLSCREADGCEIIKGLTGREVSLMPDPTLCLSADEWRKIEKKPDFTVPEHYILVYFLGDKSPEDIQEISKFAEQNGLPVIDIYDMNSEYFLTRPDEFLFLVRNADYMFTNSFHGSVFSIIFDRQLRVFGRNDSIAKGMGGRLATLLSLFKLTKDERGIVHTSDETKEMLQSMQDKASDYLNSALQ